MSRPRSRRLPRPHRLQITRDEIRRPISSRPTAGTSSWTRPGSRTRSPSRMLRAPPAASTRFSARSSPNCSCTRGRATPSTSPKCSAWCAAPGTSSTCSTSSTATASPCASTTGRSPRWTSPPATRARRTAVHRAVLGADPRRTYAKAWRPWQRFSAPRRLPVDEGGRRSLAAFVAWVLREGGRTAPATRRVPRRRSSPRSSSGCASGACTSPATTRPRPARRWTG